MRLKRRTLLKVSAGIGSIITLAGCTEDDTAETQDEHTRQTATPEGSESNKSNNDPTEKTKSESGAKHASEEEEATDRTLELLAEERIDHEHACLHAEFDERESIEAAKLENAPETSQTHVIWEVIYNEKQKYVVFNADEHEHEGPFIFYFANGTASVQSGTVIKKEEVSNSKCEKLDSYFQVKPISNNIVFELM